MNVSQFELLFKLQAPAGSAPDIDTVLQGYFLKITNLEDKTLRFAVDFVIAPPTVSERGLEGNTIVFVDIPPNGDNLQGQLLPNTAGDVFRPSFGTIPIPPNGTALLAVLPDIFPMGPDMTPITTANFEVRGHVRIRVPSVRGRAQSRDPVKVLLTPQNRASFLENNGTVITEQIQATLPLGEGKAEYALDPEPGLFVDLVPDFDLELPTNASSLLDDDIQVDLLAALLQRVNTKSDVKGFNKALKDNKIPFSLKVEKT